MSLLVWLHDMALSTSIRESDTVWGYPTVLFLHTLGMSLLVGFLAVIDLRILGVADHLPVKPLRRLMPLVWAGFWINAVTGSILFAIDAPAKAVNVAFWVKLGFVAAGVWTVRELDRRVLRAPLAPALVPSARPLAALSLFLWAGAVTAGRLMAYVVKS